MFLTDEQQAILNGEKGETLAKVWKTLVMYGDTFGADKMGMTERVLYSSFNHRTLMEGRYPALIGC